jgi:hypothetical protein
MKNPSLKPRLIVIFTIIIAGAFMRLIPHWPNFTPIAAIALFGGAYLERRYLAYLIPLAALFISDLIIGFHDYMIAVYLAFAITVSLGMLLKKNMSSGRILGTALLSSVIFFLVTNFASWLGSPIYTKDFTGLLQCYVAGLAFFNDGSYGISFFFNEVLGTVFYSLVFFGAFYLARMRFPSLAKA